jgi:hypothetical protein
VSPSRRRQAVRMLQDRLGLSERRACQITGQHRSPQRHECRTASDDGALRERLHAISRERPRWGYWRAHSLLREEGWTLNRKPDAAALEGLRVPQRRRKRQRPRAERERAPRLVPPQPGRQRLHRTRLALAKPVRQVVRLPRPRRAARRRAVRQPRRAKLLVEGWRQGYNTNRAHSALAVMAPARFAAAWQERHTTGEPAREADGVATSLRSPSGLAPRDGDATTTLRSRPRPPTLRAGGPMNGVRSRERLRHDPVAQ